jgi:two-component system cell cycle response regulator DivK
VLLVQPERDDRDMYAEFLRDAGLTLMVVSHAAPALRLARDADVIVTGLLLPGHMDGFEFMARLKRDDRTTNIPIIVLTSSAWQTERARAEHAGCDVFLSKPCLPDALLHEIRRLLALRRVSKPQPARVPTATTIPRHRRTS